MQCVVSLMVLELVGWGARGNELKLIILALCVAQHLRLRGGESSASAFNNYA